MRRWQPIFILFLVCTVCLLSAPVEAQDQEPTPVFIHSTIDEDSLNDSAPGIDLNVFFTLKDVGGEQITSGISVDMAEIQVKGGDLKKATKTELAQQTPIKVAIVLDRSKSMEGNFDNIGDYANQAIDKIAKSNPPASEFSVWTFAGKLYWETEDLGGFVGPGTATSIITSKYLNYDEGDQKTCLLGATSSVIGVVRDQVQKTPNIRRAIILFTDGRSDPSDIVGNNCDLDRGDPREQNKITDEIIDQTIKFAINQVPIYTIGLCTGDDGSEATEAQRCPGIDRDLLQRIAQNTGGTRQLPYNNDDALDKSFTQIADGINSQWVAHVTVFPCKSNSGTLYVTVSRDSKKYDLPGVGITFPYDPNKCDTAPPPQAIASITTVPAESEDGKFYVGQFTIQSEKLDTIKRIEIQVVNTKDSIPIASAVKPIDFKATDPQPLPITIPAGILSPGSKYTVIIRAFGEGNVPIRTDTQKDVLAQDEFGTKAAATIQAPQISKISPQLIKDTEAGQVLPVQLVVADPSKQIKPGFVTCHVEIQDIPSATREQDGCDRDNWRIIITIPQTSTQLLKGNRYTLNVELRLQDQPPIKASHPFEPEFEQEPTWLEKNGSYVLGTVLTVLACAAIVAAILYLRQRPEPLRDPRQPVGGRDPVTGLRPSVPPPTLKPSDRPSTKPPPVLVEPWQEPAATQLPDATVVVDGPALPMPHLRARVMQSDDEKMEGQEPIFTTFPIVIGRIQGDLIIKDPKISNPHAKIGLAPDGKSFVLTIIKSSNRTFVGTEQLEEGATMPFTDRIVMRLGPKTVVEFTPKL